MSETNKALIAFNERAKKLNAPENPAVIGIPPTARVVYGKGGLGMQIVDYQFGDYEGMRRQLDKNVQRMSEAIYRASESTPTEVSAETLPGRSAGKTLADTLASGGTK